MLYVYHFLLSNDPYPGSHRNPTYLSNDSQGGWSPRGLTYPFKDEYEVHDDPG